MSRRPAQEEDDELSAKRQRPDEASHQDRYDAYQRELQRQMGGDALQGRRNHIMRWITSNQESIVNHEEHNKEQAVGSSVKAFFNRAFWNRIYGMAYNERISPQLLTPEKFPATAAAVQQVTCYTEEEWSMLGVSWNMVENIAFLHNFSSVYTMMALLRPMLDALAAQDRFGAGVQTRLFTTGKNIRVLVRNGKVFKLRVVDHFLTDHVDKTVDLLKDGIRAVYSPPPPLAPGKRLRRDIFITFIEGEEFNPDGTSQKEPHITLIVCEYNSAGAARLFFVDNGGMSSWGGVDRAVLRPYREAMGLPEETPILETVPGLSTFSPEYRRQLLWFAEFDDRNANQNLLPLSCSYSAYRHLLLLHTLPARENWDSIVMSEADYDDFYFKGFTRMWNSYAVFWKSVCTVSAGATEFGILLPNGPSIKGGQFQSDVIWAIYGDQQEISRVEGWRMINWRMVPILETQLADPRETAQKMCTVSGYARRSAPLSSPVTWRNTRGRGAYLP